MSYSMFVLASYGTTQIQSLEDTRFENLDGTGGVTLRLETGVGLPGAYVNGIVAHNIVCRDGHAAVMVRYLLFCGACVRT